MTDVVETAAAPLAADANLHIVVWRDVYRVLTELGTVVAVCATLEEAEAYIAGQDAGS